MSPTVVEGWRRFHFLYINLPFVFLQVQVLCFFPVVGEKRIGTVDRKLHIGLYVTGKR